MAKVKLTKEEADRIAKIKGNVSGTIFQAYYKLILGKKGEKSLRKVEERMKELGYPVKFKETSSFKWYPESLACLASLVSLEVFDWDESRAFDIGYEAPLHSILVKLLIKYISVETMLREAPKYWQKHFDFGKLHCTKYNSKKSYAILRLDGFKKFHLTVYIYIWGYLTRLVELVTKSKNVKVEQIKSLYNNDPYDEFKIRW